MQTLKKHFKRQDREVRRRIRAGEERAAGEGDIWLGDFNRHHPMWDDDTNIGLFTRANLDVVEELIELVASRGMEMVLPKGIPTIKNAQGNCTRPDNVFCSGGIEDWVIQCATSPGETPPKADHFPIHTTIDFSMKGSAHSYSFNYRAIERDVFVTDLIKNLKKIPEPQWIDNEDQFHNTLNGLTKAIRTQ